jgi:hypothetical protein
LVKIAARTALCNFLRRGKGGQTQRYILGCGTNSGAFGCSNAPDLILTVSWGEGPIPKRTLCQTLFRREPCARRAASGLLDLDRQYRANNASRGYGTITNTLWIPNRATDASLATVVNYYKQFLGTRLPRRPTDHLVGPLRNFDHCYFESNYVAHQSEDPEFDRVVDVRSPCKLMFDEN